MAVLPVYPMQHQEHTFTKTCFSGILFARDALCFFCPQAGRDPHGAGMGHRHLWAPRWTSRNSHRAGRRPRPQPVADSSGWTGQRPPTPQRPWVWGSARLSRAHRTEETHASSRLPNPAWHWSLDGQAPAGLGEPPPFLPAPPPGEASGVPLGPGPEGGYVQSGAAGAPEPPSREDGLQWSASQCGRRGPWGLALMEQRTKVRGSLGRGRRCPPKGTCLSLACQPGPPGTGHQGPAWSAPALPAHSLTPSLSCVRAHGCARLCRPPRKHSAAPPGPEGLSTARNVLATLGRGVL